MKRWGALVLVLSAIAWAQDVLTNETVVKLVKAGLGESVVLSMIQSQPGKYATGAEDILKLKEQGVTDKELSAILAKSSGAPAIPSGSASSPTATDLPPNIEIGVYYKKSGQWQEMLPEVVNWKTGGVVKHIASVGVVKQDVNGRLQGASSKNSVGSPVELLIYTPEGVAITEYQLLHLREHGEAREFRTVTGGVFHESSGANRDVMDFDATKIASRTFKVLLQRPGPGQFGLLPPGAITAANSTSIGKMYTFRVSE